MPLINSSVCHGDQKEAENRPMLGLGVKLIAKIYCRNLHLKLVSGIDLEYMLKITIPFEEVLRLKFGDSIRHDSY